MSRLCDKCLAVKSGDVVIHDPECETQGISPAQLRERVEALEVRCASISATASIAIGTLSDRIDAALKRIEATDLVVKEQYRAIGLLNERVHLLERDMFDVHPNALSGGKR